MTACFGQETFHFDGESDNWKVEYIIDVLESKNSEEGTIKIKYIGESEAPNHIDYYIKDGSSEMSGDLSMQDGTFETQGSNCSGCAVTKEDDEFEVTIEWNGESEHFTLKNVD